MIDCAGIIAFEKKTKNVLLLHHRSGEYWGFCKGFIEKGEAEIIAADRELFEETRLQIFKWIWKEPIEEVFSFMRGEQKVTKRVFYFGAFVEGNIHIDPEEIISAQFFSPEQAMKKLTYETSKKTLKKALKKLEEASF